MFLRDSETHKKYEEHRKNNADFCPFCAKDKMIREYRGWVIINNDFPYRNTTEHLLVAPKEHTQEVDESLIWDIRKMYPSHLFLHNSFTGQSLKQHFHFHLIKY